MFTLTSAAAQQIQQSATASDAQQLALRVAARRGADGDVEYGMGFDEPNDDDMKLDILGVPVVISLEHQDLLEQTTLDFVEMQPGQFNFIFVDGREQAGAASAGGCGTGGCGSGSCGGGSCH